MTQQPGDAEGCEVHSAKAQQIKNNVHVGPRSRRGGRVLKQRFGAAAGILWSAGAAVCGRHILLQRNGSSRYEGAFLR
eukprot:CAMPEP_0181472180 /NCGR_PEP_ID=MMETSP1110-20121109/39465_1 /TAXON_ID=174948 /ORGANISM="Symbiodinium sp., Strain CCMP421" /LENGTH=77 /DNA_ID=CAMNT_0023597237 /DNA_START=46 /DNA_END=280 /DNA_ORIENTATION=-